MKKSVSRRRGARGLSLLETLLATFMFVTVMVSLMDVWVAHSRAFDKSQGQEVAAMLAQQIMEQELELGYAATNITAPVSYTVYRTMRGVSQSSVFNYTVLAEPPTATPGGPENPVLPVGVGPYPGGPYYQVIVVTVNWFDSTGTHTISLECNGGW